MTSVESQHAGGIVQVRVPVEDLGHTTVRHLQSARNLARSRSFEGHLENLVAEEVGKRSSVGEDATVLVDVLVVG